MRNVLFSALFLVVHCCVWGSENPLQSPNPRVEVTTPEAGKTLYREYRTDSGREYLYREATYDNGLWTKFAINRPGGLALCTFDINASAVGGPQYQEFTDMFEPESGRQIPSITIIVKNGVLTLFALPNYISANRLHYFKGRSPSAEIDIRYNDRVLVVRKHFATGASSEYTYRSREHDSGYALKFREEVVDLGEATITLPVGIDLYCNNELIDPSKNYYAAFQPYLEALREPAGYFIERQDSIVTRRGRFDLNGDLYWSRDYDGEGNVISEEKPGIDSITRDDELNAIPNSVATFPGGIGKFQEWLAQSLAKTITYLDRETSVTISFVVKTDGTLSDVTVIDATNYFIGVIVAAQVCKSPKWIPAILDSEPADMSVTIPMFFGPSTGEKKKQARTRR